VNPENCSRCSFKLEFPRAVSSKRHFLSVLLAFDWIPSFIPPYVIVLERFGNTRIAEDDGYHVQYSNRAGEFGLEKVRRIAVFRSLI
jgi:hypothetical protein